MAFTNRRMANIIGAGIVSTRRWCLLILGEDPQAALHDGKPRTMSRMQAFKVFLARFLNDELGLSVGKVGGVVDVICPFIESRGLLPEKIPEPPFPSVHILINSGATACRFFLRLKTIQKQEKTQEDGISICTETYRLENINLSHVTGKIPFYWHYATREIDLTAIVHHFISEEARTADMI